LPVTETSSTEQELQEAHLRIEHLERAVAETQRLATVGQLASRMAHEFNNVLQIITGWADHALRHEDVEQKDKALQKTVEQGRRAADIVTSLLGYSTGRQNKPEVVAADALLEAAASLIAWDLPKDKIQLVREYKASAKVRVIPARIEQSLLNLILNARQAMAKRGGTLTLGVALVGASHVALSVQDTGCGIPPEIRDKIFQPFFTTRSGPNPNGTGGNGLGLAVVRELVQQAGGEIRLVSTVGVGSTFTVLLPIVEPTN
jgi:signal transduction histidine kinase